MLIEEARQVKLEGGGDDSFIGKRSKCAIFGVPRQAHSGLSLRKGRSPWMTAASSVPLCRILSGLSYSAGSVVAGPFRRQAADLLYARKIESGRCKFGDLPAAARSHFQVEYLCRKQATRGPLVHGEEMAAFPIPTVVGVEIVNADHHFHLGLSPKTRAIGPTQPHSGIKIGEGKLAIAAEKIDTRLVVGIFAEVIIGQQFEADLLGAGHLVIGLEHHPLAAGTDAVPLALIRAHRATLSAGRECRREQHDGR